MAGFDEFIAAGVDMCYYGIVDDEGYLQGGATPPVNGNATGGAMLRIRGAVSADPTIPEPEVVDVPGDNRSQGQFIFDAAGFPSFALGNTVFDLARIALLNGSTKHSDGDITSAALQPEDATLRDVCWVLQSPAKKKDIALNGVQAWSGYIIPSSQVYPLGRAGFNTKQAAQENSRVVTNPAGVRPDGASIATLYGKPSAPIIPFSADNPVVFHTWRGNGTEDEFVLPYVVAAASAAKVNIRVDGAAQTYTTDFTVTIGAGISTIKFESGSIPALGEKVVFFGEILV